MRGWWWCGRVISPARHKWRPTRSARVTERWTPRVPGPTRRWDPRGWVRPGGGEGDTYSGMRPGAVGLGGRSPPGAADMALIFSGAAWHGCMVPWAHGMRHHMAIQIAVCTSMYEGIVNGPCVWCFATCFFSGRIEPDD